MDMDPLVAHQRAQQVFAAVLADVKPGQMDGPTPCEQWTVAELIEHVIGGNERVVIRAGLPASPVSRADGLVPAHRDSAAQAAAVFADPETMVRVFELPVGPMPGSMFLRIRTIDALVHAWDLAKATGQSTDLDPELASGVLAASRGTLPSNLRGVVFGDPQPCAEDCPPADQLAAYLGRPVR